MKTKLLLIVVLTIFLGCSKTNNTLILVSKDSNSSVTNWILSIDASVKIKKCYNLSNDSLTYYLSKANGFIITGGEDVNPELYGHPEYQEVCGTINDYRDSLELRIINYAMKNHYAILGICRGHQLLNVANGGTLIPDIPSFIIDSNINHRVENDSAHIIIPQKDSWIGSSTKYWVNSIHHQCVNKIAPNFKIAAISQDSVIESIEIKDKLKHKFAIGIQWHPEILRDSLSNALGSLFIKNCRN